MHRSYWYDGNVPQYPALNQDIETDVAVIGGGLAGVMCAYELAQRGYSVCVLEAGRIGCGETLNSSAMLSFCHDDIYRRLISKHGLDTARQYLALNEKGLLKIRNVIKKHGIDCGYSECSMVLYATTKKGARQIKKEQQAYEKLGRAVRQTAETELPFEVTKALTIHGQGFLNPFAFIHGVCMATAEMGAKIFEHTRVAAQPENGELKAVGHTIKAKHFVIATHFPYLILPGFYFLKMYQDRSHNIVFNADRTIANIYESVEDDGFEYRPAGDGILCGGANVRTGKYKYESQYRIVEQEIRKHFRMGIGMDNDSSVDKNSGSNSVGRDFDSSKGTVKNCFSAQDCMTFDMLPFVGAFSSFMKNVWIISGFNKWGFTTSAAASDIIADCIEDKDMDYNIFDTKRLYMLKAPLKAAANTGVIAASFANLLLNTDAKKIKRLGSGQGAVIRHKGKRIGVYRDTDGTLMAVSAVCPHMGCSLKWNKDELSWDCPCHGSRFDIHGRILTGPAVENATTIHIEQGLPNQ